MKVNEKSLTAKLLTVMRISAVQGIFILSLTGIAVAHPNYGQLLDKEISVSFTGLSFEEALDEIAAAANVKFAYSTDQLEHEPPVSLSIKKRPLRQVLDELLTPRRIRYKVHEKESAITLSKERDQESDRDHLRGNDRAAAAGGQLVVLPVTGTVTEAATHVPMGGVNVLIKGTTNGTATGADGKYSIEAVAGDVLVFSFIGYQTIEEAVNGRSQIDVSLSEDVVSLKDVEINAGYWTLRDEERTGNISRVTASEIARQPVSNPLAALSGRMPGVLIQQSTGLPGGGVTIQIRGVNSLRSQANYPLYLVDGVPYNASPLSSSSVGGEILPSASPLSSINPNDIESIEILKDADATAIYGSRGANGVVLITTKKGRSGKTNFNVRFSRGFSSVERRMDLLNTPQYLQMRREANANDGIVANTLNAPDLLQWDTTRYTDWQEELIGGTASLADVQAAISGGNENTQFFFSGGYYHEGTVFPGDFGYRKGSGHLNLNHQSPDGKFDLILSLSYTSDGNDLPRQDLTAQAVTLQPVAPPVYDDAGKLNWANATWSNPMAALLRRYENNNKSLVSNATLSYSLTPDLVAKTSLGYTSVRFNETQSNPRASYNPTGNFMSSVSWGDNDIITWIAEPQLEYQRKISHAQLRVLVGTTFQETDQKSQSFLATGFPSDAMLSNIRSATSVMPSNWNSVGYRYHAVFSRINLSWQEKYILNVTGRTDASSRFGDGNHFGNFGAAGLAWIFTEEPFIDGVSFLTFGKLRTSYGLTGSDQIPDYGYLDTYSSSLYPYQAAGLYPTRLANPDYGWETNRKFEGALDLAFMSDQITLSASYYDNRSSNQLVGYSLPATAGQNSVQANLGATVQNSGWEFELTARNRPEKSFKWSSSVNFTFPRNRLIAFPDIQSSSYANTYVVGKSLFVLKKIHHIGVDPENGLYTFEDVDGNGVGTDRPADVQVLKEVTQDFYGGFRNVVSYKGVELDVFFQFVSQTGRNYLNTFTAPPGSRFSNQPELVMERWHEAGQIADVQKFTTTGNSPAGTAYRSLIFDSDAIVSDASFLRLKNVELSWDVPARWIEKVKGERFKLYLQGQNLMTFTRYSGLDPENQLATALPPLRTFTIGTQITF